MLELPEAAGMAQQVKEKLKGKTVAQVTPLKSPHKFAWFEGDPMHYPDLLEGRAISGADFHGGMVEILFEGISLILGDGVNIRYHATEQTLPPKHQLLLRFKQGDFLCFSLQMYGGIVCVETGKYDNPYYLEAVSKPSPVSPEFSLEYFLLMTNHPDHQKLSAKAFLATEQRIPGLGNGTLQDILFQANIHPKRKLSTMSPEEKKGMYISLTSVLKAMTEKGGRNTEKDLYGRPCGYPTLMSKNTLGEDCPQCSSAILKASYMGGTVYFCPVCQSLNEPYRSPKV